ncbi:aldo/keto reductase [Tetragenococcus solitarius]|uniref:Aldo/keto reductase n=1 Tax=Tetragenococcus solitarius TaxID=71453 RepID=A0ABP6L352_9ENTE|nr:aldo/keto reductase [Tetragenococcus solitarius]
MTIPNKQLIDGTVIPQVGFGTAGLKGAQGVQVLTTAINNGYRLLDTAYNYENEATVGQAVKKSSVARENLLITSKLPGRHHKYHDAIAAIQESLYRADLDYYDLYLIHWPNPMRDEYVEAWQALIDAKRFGLVRSIGVSNFLPEHLEKLKNETGVLPVVNQVEMHPLFSQKEQREYHEKHQIVTEAWSPLGGVQQSLSKPITELPELVDLAQKYHKNVGQIILRWETQLNVVPLPLSRNPFRQKENRNIFDFELTESEIQQIISLDQEDARVSSQDPRTHEEL